MLEGRSVDLLSRTDETRGGLGQFWGQAGKRQFLLRRTIKWLGELFGSVPATIS